MEVKINVDETMFKNVIEEELKAFSNEELHEIIRECIVEALHNDNTLRNLFVIDKKDYWGNYVGKEPSEVVIEAAKNIDLSPAYKEVQEKMITALQTDYRNILENVMMGLMVDSISNDRIFQQRMKESINRIISDRRVNN